MRVILSLLSVLTFFVYAQDSLNTLTVRGEGIVEPEPDLAIIQLGIALQDASAHKVYQNTEELVKEITKAALAAGIKKDDIKTGSLSLYPHYDYSDYVQKILGYQMNCNLTIRVRDLKKLSNVIEMIARASTNTTFSIFYGFQEPEKLETQARTKAFKDASRKAQELAKAANLKLGRIVKITEEIKPGGGGEGCATPYGMGDGLGPNTIKVVVNLTYEIKE
ncbi:MAG: SIMPL domain-containing protein [candidate division WOR-3 bacterium]